MAANLYPTIWKPVDAVTITAGGTLWTPPAGMSIRLLGYCLVASAAGNIQLQESNGTVHTLKLVVPSGAGGAAFPHMLEGQGIKFSAAGLFLRAIGITGSVSGWVCGREE